eukprot:371900-Pyramimonas_sp.AAC.1
MSFEGPAKLPVPVAGRQSTIALEKGEETRMAQSRIASSAASRIMSARPVRFRRTLMLATSHS